MGSHTPRDLPLHEACGEGGGGEAPEGAKGVRCFQRLVPIFGTLQHPDEHAGRAAGQKGEVRCTVTAAEKRQLDQAPYEQVLRTWRFTWAGNALFQDDYYSTVLSRKREKVAVKEHIKVSERVGWPDP